MTQLSDKVKDLIAKSRIVSFAGWEATHPPTAIQILQAADDEGRYLTDNDLQQLQTLSPDTSELISFVQFFRDNVAEIVDEARAQLLVQYPRITEPGGELYPTERAAACWRDCWHFLRCITYGMAGGNTQYTSPTGLHYMNLLYKELRVPLAAMVLGLESIKAASLKRCQLDEQAILAPYFDHFISNMVSFSQ